MEAKHIDGVMRTESILILPYNTIKFIDLPIQIELNKLIDKNEDLDETVLHLLCRKEKSLAKFNEVSEDNLNTFIENNKIELYKNAPFTNMVDMLMGTVKQKFVSNVNMLFDNKDLSSENILIKNAYYDGTYEGLLKYMKGSSFTCLFISDIDLLYKLAKDGIDLDGKTIFVSKLGYNYDQTEGGALYLRHYQELKDMFNYFDMVTFDLFPVSYNEIEKDNKEGE